MFWHIDTDIISLIVMASIYLCDRFFLPQSGTASRNKRFSGCLESGLFVAVMDIAASVIMEIPVSRLVYHLVMTLYFVTIELVIVEWFLYVLMLLYPKESKARKAIAHIVVLLYTGYALFCSANPWTQLIYFLNENNEYHRGPFFGIMLVLYALYTVALLALVLLRWKRIPENYPRLVILLTPLIIAVGIVVQLMIPGWLFIIPSYMICLLLAFLFVQTMLVQMNQKQMKNLSVAAETDALTGLLNRSGMDMMVEKTRIEGDGEKVLVLIADIDDLKQINDTMGHAEGDRAIRLVASQLKRFFRTNDAVVRYGGDEFLVFLTGMLNQEQADAALSQLVRELNKLRIGKDNDVPLHGSIGASCGQVGMDSFRQLCEEADAALYYVKRHGKNGFALYSPDMKIQKAEQ